MDYSQLVIASFFIPLVGIILLPLFPSHLRSVVNFVFTVLNAAITSSVAIAALVGHTTEVIFSGINFWGDVSIRVDSLSAWFMLIVNLICVQGALYGIGYMKKYSEQRANLALHWVLFLVFHSSMLWVCMLQHGLAFLIAWELMSASSFLLVIFEYQKWTTLKAGLNYLVQMHLSVLFLTIGIIWSFNDSGDFDFSSISRVSASLSTHMSLILFFFFFIGFAFKAGFVPFHTWLPYAHPAAPTHISGVMSGVIIKMGIYGILRMLLLVHTDLLAAGWIILAVSVISGLYGVMLAIIQHNLKKLLAYHSIENIGIIGIGIGLGCIGLGTQNNFLAAAGFAGALLHTLNHSLFKSMLFFGAGNVYQAARTLNIEALGGLMKRMPQTALLFLLAALAICGLPPFNGFISEFIIYTGLFNGMMQEGISHSVFMILSILGLALIGGLAMLCFTKAFGIVFLGTERKLFKEEPKEAGGLQLFPMYVTGALILAVGLFPQGFLKVLSEPVVLFVRDFSFSQDMPFIKTLQSVSIASAAFIALVLLILFLRSRLATSRSDAIAPTWGCGYVAPVSRAQYTANSFIRTYRKLARPALQISKKSSEVKEIFPQQEAIYETHPYDKLEAGLVDIPVLLSRRFFNAFRFLQNGRARYYILYGVVFILAMILISIFSE